LIQLYRWFPSILKVLTIGPSCALAQGRLSLVLAAEIAPPREGDRKLRGLIGRMGIENPLGRAPIHGELLKLGLQRNRTASPDLNEKWTVRKMIVDDLKKKGAGDRSKINMHEP
jgi:hypothetical protein